MKSDYATAAYLVFAAALAWDYLAPRLRLRRALQAIAARSRRESARKTA